MLYVLYAIVIVLLAQLLIARGCSSLVVTALSLVDSGDN